MIESVADKRWQAKDFEDGTMKEQFWKITGLSNLPVLP
jgi:hypothetical protein